MTDSNESPTNSDTDQNQQDLIAEINKPVATKDLTRSAGRGAIWQVIGSLWQLVVQLGSSAVLARVLFPEDFGVMGMAVLAQGLIGRIGILGTGTGVIAKEDVTQEDLSTAFWISVAVQGFLFLVLFAGAPVIAMFFRPSEGVNPDEFLGNLTCVLRVTSCMFLFTAVGAVSSTLLAKRLRFVMSHSTGKIEIVGLTKNRVYFKYHRAADDVDSGRFLVLKRNPNACWLDDYDEIIRDYAVNLPYRSYGPD